MEAMESTWTEVARVEEGMLQLFQGAATEVFSAARAGFKNILKTDIICYLAKLKKIPLHGSPEIPTFCAKMLTSRVRGGSHSIAKILHLEINN